jgi:hypothetical protein
MHSSAVVAVFALAVWLVLFLAQVVEVFAFGHFEGALGGRFENVALGAIVSGSIALLVATGFAVGLRLYRVRSLPKERMLALLFPLAGGVCALVYAFGALRARLSSLPESWPFNAALVAALCVLLGGLAAFAVVRLNARTQGAA